MINAEIVLIPATDLATTATPSPELVAHYQAAGNNVIPVMVARQDGAYTILQGDEHVAAMQAAGLKWVLCCRMPMAAATAELAAAAAPKARKAAPKARKAKAPTVKELKAKAKAAGHRGYSRMTKAQLLALLGG